MEERRVLRARGRCLDDRFFDGVGNGPRPVEIDVALSGLCETLMLTSCQADGIEVAYAVV